MLSAAELQRLHQQQQGGQGATLVTGSSAGAPMSDPFPSLTEDPFPASAVNGNGRAAGTSAAAAAAGSGAKGNKQQEAQPDL